MKNRNYSDMWNETLSHDIEWNRVFVVYLYCYSMDMCVYIHIFKQQFTLFCNPFVFSFFMVLGIKHGALCVIVKHFATEL